MEFEDLGLEEPILRAIRDEHFKEPTEIQAKAIPLVLEGKDVTAESATGSGKTLAFASGIIQFAEKNKGIQALILTPTRELAEQVSDSLKKFSKYVSLNITAVYGGVSIDRQIRNLRKADVVVGTPGRILDHIQRRTIDLRRVNTLVLDEADRMLDMGFQKDVESIIRTCPRNRQTLMFSATLSGELRSISKKYLNNPVNASVKSQVDPAKLKQVYYEVQPNVKFSLLAHMLKEDDSYLVMVFCNSRKYTDWVAFNLKNAGIKARAIHGGLTQHRRTRILKEFHESKVNVLVCTDVAARGLDIDGVSHVYNYDVPQDGKQYIHRIGRTARAGKEGMAVTLLSQRDHFNFRRVIQVTDRNSLIIKRMHAPRVNLIRTQNPVASFTRRQSFHSRAPRNNFRRW